MSKEPNNKNCNITARVCENIVYLAELNGVMYVRSIESSLGLSPGYLSRCMNHENKRISADVVYEASKYFDVSVGHLMNHDLRAEGFRYDG